MQEGEGHDILAQAQGEGKEISLPLQGRVTSFPNPYFKIPTPPPLLISDKSLNLDSLSKNLWIPGVNIPHLIF